MRELLLKKQNDLINYSPYRFIRSIDKQSLVLNTVIEPLLKELEDEDVETIDIVEGGFVHFFILKKLQWDTKYFGYENYKITNVLFDHRDINILLKAVWNFKNNYCKNARAYYFIDLPSEEILLQQAFTGIGFRLIESRLNYFFDQVANYENKMRFDTRNAKLDDADCLRNIAMKMRNRYGRFHADANINPKVADQYIGQFAYNSVLGFADIVLVPDIDKNPPFGFLAFDKPVDVNVFKVSKLVLTAIDNTYEKGWLFKLLSEAVILLKEYDVDYLTTITQTSNVAAIRTWEKFGFKLGFVTNILTLRND